MQRSLTIAALILGIVAVLAIAGALRPMPPYLAFFVGSLAIFLFPGSALAACDPRTSRSLSLPETLALWFALGVGALSVTGLVGLTLKTTVSRLSLALAVVFGCLVLLVAASLVSRWKASAPRTLPDIGRIACIFILALAVICGLVTLLTPRDVDDWYYLAHIRDFVSDHSIRSEDAILDAGHAASPRIWYASWWVAEAIVSRASGVDPVTTHQVYLPLLIAPFTVLAAFMLARQIFRDRKAAMIGASLQVLFYLSSAYPYNSAGWLVFCRISQDKAVACFLMAPVAVALGLRFLRERGVYPAHELNGDAHTASSPWRSFGLYLSALVSALLVHPLSIVWTGVSLVPFALVETLRCRSRATSYALLALVLPLITSGVFLAAGMGDVSSELETKAARQTQDLRQSPESGEPAPFKNMRSQRETAPNREQPAAGDRAAGDRERIFSLYFPGQQLPWASEEGALSTVLRRQAEPIAASPLYVTRYPLALLGLILTFLLLCYVRRDPAARILFATTIAVLILAFVPLGAALTAKALTWKLVYRLAWVLPWGFTTGFFIARIRLRRVPPWIFAVVLALALARGNPANYVKVLRQWNPMLRPDREAADVLGVLAREPAPQGVVIASAGTTRMIPAFVADAYPASYRGSGTITRAELEWITASTQLSAEVTAKIAKSGARYVLIEKSAPLSRALAGGASGFRVIHDNSRYELWRITSP